MKRAVWVFAAIILLTGNQVNGQKSGLLKKVANSMANELLGKPQTSNAQQPEPDCACDPSELVIDLGGKLQLNYTELDISVRDDGAILLKDKISGNFYIAKDGLTQGPIPAGDRRLAGFDGYNENDNNDTDLIVRFGQYISKTGDKFLITFGGKTYGPYAQINSFAVPKSKDKFAALVVENIVATEDQGRKMDEAMKNAKTDQERMDLAMQFGQQMANKIAQGGGAQSIMPKFITNVPDATYNPMSELATLNADMKFDDILLVKHDGISDMKGNKIITLKPEHASSSDIFINSANTNYAFVNYGELTFSDGTPKLNGLFNPYLMKADGKIYLAYMYYSPKKNAILKCKIPY